MGFTGMRFGKRTNYSRLNHERAASLSETVGYLYGPRIFFPSSNGKISKQKSLKPIELRIPRMRRASIFRPLPVANLLTMDLSLLKLIPRCRDNVRRCRLRVKFHEIREVNPALCGVILHPDQAMRLLPRPLVKAFCFGAQSPFNRIIPVIKKGHKAMRGKLIL